MSKLDKLNVLIGVLATIGFLIVAGWAQWGSEPFPDGPSDYNATVNTLKWVCVFLGLMTPYLTKRIIPQRI